MIVYPDGSNNNGAPRLGGAVAAYWKLSQGSTFRDWTFPAALAQMAGKPFAGYHWADPSDPFAQAANAKAAWPNFSATDHAPLMFDWEDLDAAGNPTLTVPDMIAQVRAFWSYGFDVFEGYLPRWYWVRMGRPDLRPIFTELKLSLHSSDYDVNGAPSPNAFVPYGNVTPTQNQYTSNGPGGLDSNRFPGTLAELASLITGKPITAKGPDMRAYILSGFPGQPDWTQGRYHVEDNSVQGYHVVPLGAWNAAAWPDAVPLSPAATGGSFKYGGLPIPGTQFDILVELFGPGLTVQVPVAPAVTVTLLPTVTA